MIMEKLEESVNNILTRYKEKTGNLEPPIKVPILRAVIESIEKINIKIIPGDSDAINEGSLEPVGGGFILKFSKNCNTFVRRRLTICHEFIHIFSYNCKLQKPEREYYISQDECYKYARILLVPTESLQNIFHNYRQENPDVIATIKTLSKVFRVSVDTIIYRLKELSLLSNTIVTFWRVPTAFKTKLDSIHLNKIYKQSFVFIKNKELLSNHYRTIIKDILWNKHIKCFINSAGLNNSGNEEISIKNKKMSKNTVKFSVLCAPKNYITESAFMYNLKPPGNYEIISLVLFDNSD